MATYQELITLNQDDKLKQQVKAAIAVAAFSITNEVTSTPNHVARLAWAKAALRALDGEVERVMWYVLAENKSFSLGTISTASDVAVQTSVDAAVNLFAS